MDLVSVEIEEVEVERQQERDEVKELEWKNGGFITTFIAIFVGPLIFSNNTGKGNYNQVNAALACSAGNPSKIRKKKLPSIILFIVNLL